MSFVWNANLHVVSLVGSLAVALVVMMLRLRAASKPVNVMKIIMPTVGMSTGFLMFVVPMMRIPFLMGLVAFLTGAILFSYPLIRTSRMYVENGEVYMQRSKAFMAIILVLLIIRVALHEYVEQFVSIYQTGALFFVLAFGMLLPWRIAMYIEYRKLGRKN